MCVNPVCGEFWKIGDQDPTLLDLKYTERFLELQPVASIVGLDQDLRPRLPTQNPSDGINTTYTFTRGWHCRDCGRLSTRFAFRCFLFCTSFESGFQDTSGSTTSVQTAASVYQFRFLPVLYSHTT
jgi:hypothetical protein